MTGSRMRAGTYPAGCTAPAYRTRRWFRYQFGPLCGIRAEGCSGSAPDTAAHRAGAPPAAARHLLPKGKTMPSAAGSGASAPRRLIPPAASCPYLVLGAGHLCSHRHVVHGSMEILTEQFPLDFAAFISLLPFSASLVQILVASVPCIHVRTANPASVHT